MANKITTLSPDLVQSIKELMHQVANQVVNTRMRPHVPLSEHDQAPEVYLAKTPLDGIPAATDLAPGKSATDCVVWKVIEDGSGDPIFEEVVGLKKTVYNAGTFVGGATLVVVKRDKWGRWWTESAQASGTCLPLGLGCDEPIRAAGCLQYSPFDQAMYVSNGITWKRILPTDVCTTGAGTGTLGDGTVSMCIKELAGDVCVISDVLNLQIIDKVGWTCLPTDIPMTRLPLEVLFLMGGVCGGGDVGQLVGAAPCDFGYIWLSDWYTGCTEEVRGHEGDGPPSKIRFGLIICCDTGIPGLSEGLQIEIVGPLNEFGGCLWSETWGAGSGGNGTFASETDHVVPSICNPLLRAYPPFSEDLGGAQYLFGASSYQTVTE